MSAVTADSSSHAVTGPALRKALGRFVSGVTVVTTGSGDDIHGMTANAFTSVSLDPPLVGFLPTVTSSTFKKLRTASSFCVNVLAADQQPLAQAMAVRGPHKFDGVDWTPGVTGSPVLAGTLAHVECRTEAVHPAGDHVVVIGRILDLAPGADRPPLLFHRGGYLPEG